MSNGSRLLNLKRDEQLLLGGALIVGAFLPWLLGLAGAGLVGFALWEEYGKKVLK